MSSFVYLHRHSTLYSVFRIDQCGSDMALWANITSLYISSLIRRENHENNCPDPVDMNV